jgi:hypothetical protein
MGRTLAGLVALETSSWLFVAAKVGGCSLGVSPVLCFASRSVIVTSPNSFCRLANLSSYDSVSVLEIVLNVSAASPLGFQSIGQRTPCLATA